MRPASTPSPDFFDSLRIELAGSGVSVTLDPPGLRGLGNPSPRARTRWAASGRESDGGIPHHDRGALCGADGARDGAARPCIDHLGARTLRPVAAADRAGGDRPDGCERDPRPALARCSPPLGLCSSPPLGPGGCSPTLGPGVPWAGHHDRRTLQSSRGCPARLVGARRIAGGIAESSRSHDFGVPATSTCDCSGVVSAHETPGPNAGSPMPRWGREPARGRGGIPAAKHASVPAVGRCGHS